MTDEIETNLNELTDELNRQYVSKNLDRDAFDEYVNKIDNQIYGCNAKIEKQFKNELRQLMDKFSIKKTILMK